MPVLAKKRNCCGCAACYSICPNLCIEMVPDEAGFLYPKISLDNCIECGLCTKVCPALNPIVRNTSVKGSYVVQHKDDKIRLQSTSGGAFTAIAQFIIEQEGVVFGAAFDYKFHVYHTYVETIDDLAKFRSSKYVQSVIGDAFLKAKAFLEKGRKVCFSGTPCQICGLRGFLGKDYDNLITVDFMCRAVPSPLIYDKYLELQKENLGKIQSVRFRDKCFGYSYSTLTINAIKNNKIRKYHRGIESDLWLRTFFSRICDRPSCKECIYQGEIHQSDFTIGDCANVWKFNPDFDDNLGTTRVMIQSEKGYEYFEKIKAMLRVFEVLPSEIRDKKKKKSYKMKNVDKADFYKDAHDMDASHFFNKYFPDTFKIYVLHMLRMVTYKLKIYRVLKRYIWDKFKGR
jgi:Pyruvate/2-oxoacid:ferredoxin oxidoreductase delta subunit